MKFLGIDYSMSCPCFCTLGDSGLFADSKFQYITSVKKATGSFFNGNIVGVLTPEYASEEERFNDLADYFSGWVLEVTKSEPNIMLGIEDYSFGSKGRVFHIAENMGLLKHKLWWTNTKFKMVAPTTIKKFATGKGNADKEAMHDAFTKLNNINLNGMLFPDKKLGSPVTDIVDSFYLAKYMRSLYEEQFAAN